MPSQEEINARIARDAAQPESFLTKRNPTIEDWLEHNRELFDALREDKPIEDSHGYAILTNFDEHAGRLGVDKDELFAELEEKVGPLGSLALRQVRSGMDEAWHIIIGPKPLEASASQADIAS